MRRCAAEPTFFRAVSPGWIFAKTQVEGDLIEAFFTYEIGAFRSKVAPVDDGVDQLPGI